MMGSPRSNTPPIESCSEANPHTSAHAPLADDPTRRATRGFHIRLLEDLQSFHNLDVLLRFTPPDTSRRDALEGSRAGGNERLVCDSSVLQGEPANHHALATEVLSFARYQ